MQTKRSSRCNNCFNYLTTTLRTSDQLVDYLGKFPKDSGGCNIIRRNFEKKDKVQVFRCTHNLDRAFITTPHGDAKTKCQLFNG